MKHWHRLIQVKKGVTNGNGYTLTVKEKEGIKDMTREQSGNITNNSLTGLYVNTDSKEDIVTLDEIRKRYVDINGTDEGFDNYVADGFYDGNVKEYRPV